MSYDYTKKTATERALELAVYKGRFNPITNSGEPSKFTVDELKYYPDRYRFMLKFWESLGQALDLDMDGHNLRSFYLAQYDKSEAAAEAWLDKLINGTDTEAK